MNRRKFRFLIFFGILSIVGLLGTQIYWLSRSVQIKDSNFEMTVESALVCVAQSVRTRVTADSRFLNPVEKIGEFQYTVLTNDVIDPNVLSYRLREELGHRGIKRDFYYTLFDCANKQMVFSNFVKYEGGRDAYYAPQVAWPKHNLDSYYFGVYFPDGDGLVLSGMGIWIFSSIVILFVVAFFGYAIYELLRQRRLSEIQRDFINAMTHEFKTPLASISLVGQALANPSMISDPEKIQRYSGMIRREVGRLIEQVDTILTNAKDYDRRPDLKMERLELAPILGDIQTAFADRVQHAGMHIEVKAPPGLHVLADRVHLVNMISTLADNALKYAGPSCTIKIEAETRGNAVQLSVMDNGQGMDTKTRRMAGSKFFRARHDADTPKGFGLGLFYVRNMMRNHKGRLAIQSKKGEGATVYLIFPRS